MAISDEEHQKRLELYNQGFNDRQIGEKVGLVQNGIYNWRKRNDLPANNSLGEKISKKENQKRLKYYNLGMNDNEIAEKINVTPPAIFYWREKNNLKTNHSNKISKKEHQKRLKLYKIGMIDKKIAEKINTTKKAIKGWRYRNNLETNYNNKLSKKEHEKRLKLYNEGLNDSEIAEKVDLSTETIKAWRKKNNLKTNQEKPKKILKSVKNKILKFYNLGLNDREIAEQLNISRSVVFLYRAKNNIPTHNPRNNELSSKEHRKRLKLYNKGLNDRQIAEQVSLTKGGIKGWRDRNNLPSNYNK